MADEGRWNHNIHYQRVLLDAVPVGAARALDVGCGEGVFTRALRQRVGHVVGLDPDRPSLELARRAGGDGIDYVEGDVLTYDFGDSSFDFVGSVTALHHMDMEAALHRMAALLRPGGTLGVVGVGRRRWPHDLPFDAIGFVVTRLHRLAKGEWTTPAPKVWPPPLTFAQTRRLAARALPGARFRRRLLWRYTLVWTKPA